MSDLEYYQKRAETERRLALTSANANVAAIHEELANAYEALVSHEDLRPDFRIVPTSKVAPVHAD